MKLVKSTLLAFVAVFGTAYVIVPTLEMLVFAIGWSWSMVLDSVEFAGQYVIKAASYCADNRPAALAVVSIIIGCCFSLPLGRKYQSMLTILLVAAFVLLCWISKLDNQTQANIFNLKTVALFVLYVFVFSAIAYNFLRPRHRSTDYDNN